MEIETRTSKYALTQEPETGEFVLTKTEIKEGCSSSVLPGQSFRAATFTVTPNGMIFGNMKTSPLVLRSPLMALMEARQAFLAAAKKCAATSKYSPLYPTEYAWAMGKDGIVRSVIFVNDFTEEWMLDQFVSFYLGTPDWVIERYK
jgi:hypothetical protein